MLRPTAEFRTTRATSVPGDLSPQQARLWAARRALNPVLLWLYPYDGTVWPRGLLSPILQWPTAIGGEAVKLHFKGQHVDLTLCLRTTGPAQLELPQSVWDRLSESNAGATDPITVELIVLAGGAPVGPIQEKWTFANAKMKGAVYYNTYNSKLPAAQNTGAVLRLIPGQRQPEVFLGSRAFGECTGCHSVSANGTRLSADTHGARRHHSRVERVLRPDSDDAGQSAAALRAMPLSSASEPSIPTARVSSPTPLPP